jgi:hypothetical protein
VVIGLTTATAVPSLAEPAGSAKAGAEAKAITMAEAIKDLFMRTPEIDGGCFIHWRTRQSRVQQISNRYADLHDIVQVIEWME